MLMRGFTTVRDLGGPVFGLKRAIDEGFIAGPRIYPSGAVISQTSGHGDFRFASTCRVTGRPVQLSPRSKASPPSPTAPTRCGCARASS